MASLCSSGFLGALLLGNTHVWDGIILTWTHEQLNSICATLSFQRFGEEMLGWVDPGWMPESLLSWIGERKHNERLMGWDKYEGDHSPNTFSEWSFCHNLTLLLFTSTPYTTGLFPLLLRVLILYLCMQLVCFNSLGYWLYFSFKPEIVWKTL